jgi:hypothetical protein
MEVTLTEKEEGFMVGLVMVMMLLVAAYGVRRRSVGLEERHSTITIYARVIRWGGLALFVVISLLYPSAGLAAPIWALGVLAALWLGGTVWLVMAWAGDYWSPLKVSAVLVVGWLGVIFMGEVLLGWIS